MHRNIFNTFSSRFTHATGRKMSLSSLWSHTNRSQSFNFRRFMMIGSSAVAATLIGSSYWATCTPGVMKESLIDDHTTAHVYKVVLTGGPCAGKTTILKTVRERLSQHGFDVYLVPEVATMLITGGMDFSEFTHDKLRAFQQAIITMQLTMEDGFLMIAKATKKPAVLIMDRGTLDTRAFLGSVMWDNLLEENHLELSQLRDERYDGIVHLVTAANGAPQYYTLENNEARKEDLQEAIDQDFELQEAWLGHSQHRVIDNSTGFKEKCDRAINSICSILGVKTASLRIRRFEVDPDFEWEKDAPYETPFETFNLQYNYLKSSDLEVIRRIEKRSSIETKNPFHVYTYCVKRHGEAQSSSRRLIGKNAYSKLMKDSDQQIKAITKMRTIFLHEGNSWELDEIEGTEGNKTKILTYYFDDFQDGASVKAPDFMKIEKEVEDPTKLWSYKQASEKS